MYDSNARIALGRRDGDLYSYYNKWREEFDKHYSAILHACIKLSPHVVIVEKWFHERVFDNYLWNKGIEIKKSKSKKD